MLCEICGRKEGEFRTALEGSQLVVCRECSRFGKGAVQLREQVQTLHKTPVQVQSIIKDYGQQIRKCREEKGMDHKTFSQFLGVKESLLHKIETQEYKPSIEETKRFEKILKIKLVEEVKEESFERNRKTLPTLTVADMLAMNRRN